METGEIDEQIAVYRGEALVLVAPLLVVPTELTEDIEAYGLKLLEHTEWPTLREARIRNDGLYSVAEGGELCLTSGDRREPEDKYVYIKKLFPLARQSRARGKRKDGVGGRYSSGSFQSPEVKHNSPPSATLNSLVSVSNMLTSQSL